MNLKEHALAGKIMLAPLNGTAIQISKIPEGMTPHYSGAVLILAGDQTEGDKNLNIKSEFGVSVVGDAAVVSQTVWHDIKK